MSRVISYREVYENNNKQILLSEEQYNVLKMDNVQLSVLVNERNKEIERLKNQWGKLEHWLKTDKKDAMITFETGRCFNYRDVLDKIKELKGVDKE